MPNPANPVRPTCLAALHLHLPAICSGSDGLREASGRSNLFLELLKIQNRMTKLDLTPPQFKLLLSCIIDFQSLLSLESEFAKLSALYKKLINQFDLETDDMDFIRGLLQTVQAHYRRQLEACEKHPEDFGTEFRSYYRSKVYSIDGLLNSLP
jgi:hypothetical protein